MFSLIGTGLRLVCFFFSSRRRHTRLTCDRSSDVCSSDLEVAVQLDRRHRSGTLRVGVGYWHAPGAGCRSGIDLPEPSPPKQPVSAAGAILEVCRAEAPAHNEAECDVQ